MTEHVVYTCNLPQHVHVEMGFCTLQCYTYYVHTSMKVMYLTCIHTLYVKYMYT